MINMSEDDVIDRLAAQGYEHIHGSNLIDMDYHASIDEVVFFNVILRSMMRINPIFPESVVRDAALKVVSLSSQDILTENIRFHTLLRDGVPVIVEEENEFLTRRLKIIDTERVENNTYDAVNQMTIKGARFTHRPDVILYVNGLPLVVIELKSMQDEETTIDDACA